MAKRKTRKRKVTSRKRHARSWKRWFLLMVAFGVVAASVTYFYIDRKVSRKLSNRSDDKVPAVYSDGFNVSADASYSIDFLKGELLSRRYRELSGQPKNPGEFDINGAVLRFHSRQFTAADGSLRPETNVSYDADSKVIMVDGSKHDSFQLEPEVISYLGSGELRASSYRKLGDIPKFLAVAVISIEDERFYKHFGIDLIGISRAMARNIAALGLVEGGSTITQQLAKNLVLSPRRTLGRKIQEAFAAFSLERRLSKDQILEMYLNEVYFGQEGSISIHGVSEAANTFFGKKLEDITLGEAAILAAIIKAPSYFSPRRHLDRALDRAYTVLDKMVELGAISAKDAAQAKQQKIIVVDRDLHQKSAPHFVDALTQELSTKLDLESLVPSGLSVYTGINAGMQRCAESALSDGLAQLEKQHPKLLKHKEPVQGGLLAVEPFSGKVRAWVGSRDYSSNQFDHVYQAKRQIGSTIKPFLYLTALDGSLNDYKVATPSTILPDEPINVTLVTKKTWSPENYDKKYLGDVTLRYALENSRNSPAVYLGQRVGISNFVRAAKLFRVSDNLPAVPALTLGATDTTLLQLVSAYGALANGGIYVAPRIFVSAMDGEGSTLATGNIIEERVANEAPVYVTTNILQGVIERGTGRVVRTLGFLRPAAGKTGTTNEARDGWFVGFTPNLVAGVWVGFDDNTVLGLTGGAAAAPIWTQFMKCSENYYDKIDFLPPPGVVFRNIDQSDRQLATINCPPENIVQEVYVKGTEPTSSCQLHPGTEGSEPEMPSRPNYPERRPRQRGFWDNLFG